MRSVIQLCALTGWCGLLLAQPGGNSIVTTNAAESGPPKAEIVQSTNMPAETHITSDSLRFEIDSRTVIYRGNVRLEDPRLNITCEQLTAVVPEGGQRLDSAIAETNVVMVVVDDKGITNHVFSQKAVYTFTVSGSGTNETVVWTGSPRVERPGGNVDADMITYDLLSRVVHMKNQRMSASSRHSEPAEERTELQDSAATNTVERSESTNPAADE